LAKSKSVGKIVLFRDDGNLADWTRNTDLNFLISAPTPTWLKQQQTGIFRASTSNYNVPPGPWAPLENKLSGHKYQGLIKTLQSKDHKDGVHFT